MAKQKISKRLTTGILRLGFLRSSMHNILIWPSLSVLAGLLMWGLIQIKLDDEHAVLERGALKHAASLSQAYAEQISRTVEQIDQVTLNVKVGWEASNGRLKLEEQRDRGLYPASSRLFVTVLNQRGMIVTSTLAFEPLMDHSRTSYFQTHRDNAKAGLLISEPAFSLRIKRNLIRFSRRLENADGSFNGVVTVAVEPNYLASFYDESSFGKSDFLSVRTTDGILLAAKMGDDIKALASVFRTPPVFELPRGVESFPAERFFDGQPRVIGWKTLPNYPLRSLVGLSKKEIFSALDASAADYKKFGLAGSGLLILVAVLGMLFTARLAWRKHREKEIKATYRLVIEEGGEGFFMLRALPSTNAAAPDFAILDCNERGALSTGLPKSALRGMHLSQLEPAAFWAQMIGACGLTMQTGFHEDECSLQNGPQASWMQRRLVRSGDGVAVTLRDITDAKAHQEALAHLANIDALTTLPNRHWLTQFLPGALQRASDGKSLLALLFIDLDNFKNINDTLGHSAGDELLQSAAMRLRSVMRPSDNVARLGGDEFTIVLEQIENIEAISQIGERIVSAFAEPFLLAGGSLHLVHASIGISIYPADGENAAALLKNADIAMYAAKGNGKANYQFFEPHLSETLVRRLTVEEALRRAIEQDEFILHYQPRVDAGTGALLSLEALVRWMHPTRGMVPPLEFIPVAEETGLIIGLGELVIAKTCAQLAAWKDDGLPVVPVSINVSFRQFSDSRIGSLQQSLAAHMAHHDIEPALIEIELTESCMMAEQQVIDRSLVEIQSLGVRLLVDDFGTGYSSLSQLQRLDFDVLKVDRAFTAALGESIEGEVFFRAIISMAHALGMQVVAEGVETLEQLQRLQALSCDEVQGYYISRPLPATDIPALLHRRLLFPAIERLPELALI